MKARNVLFLSAVAAAATIAGEATARDLTVTAYGGATQSAMREAWFKPYQQETGKVIVEDEGPTLAKIRAMVETGNVIWDIVDQEKSEAINGCNEGIFERLDYDRIGISPDSFVSGALGECSLGIYTAGNVLAYDGDRFPEGPTSWADFWDLKKFPGKRGFWYTPKGTLESALMADGVPPDQIYEVLRAEGGVDRAFKKLDEIKSHIVWWNSGAEFINRLASGEYAMTFAWNGRIVAANDEEDRNFKMVYPAGFTYVMDAYVVVKDTPNLDQAYEFLKFISTPERHAGFMMNVAYSGTIKDAADLLPPERRSVLPLSPENVKFGAPVDDDFWTSHFDSLTERFNAWAAK